MKDLIIMVCVMILALMSFWYQAHWDKPPQHATHVKLRAVCMRCKDPRVTATLPQRLIDGKPAPYESPEILVGGSETYEARCLNCHEVPGRPDPGEVIQGMLVGNQ